MTLLNFHFSIFSLGHLVIYSLFMILPIAGHFMDRDPSLRLFHSVNIVKLVYLMNDIYLPLGNREELAHLWSSHFCGIFGSPHYFFLSHHFHVFEGHLQLLFLSPPPEHCFAQLPYSFPVLGVVNYNFQTCPLFRLEHFRHSLPKEFHCDFSKEPTPFPFSTEILKPHLLILPA